MMDTEQRVEKLESFADDTRQRLVRIEEQLKNTASKEDIANLRGEMHQMETRILKWFVGTGFAMTSVMATVSVAAAKLIN
ncbi:MULTISPECIES: hypothetical protein [unclassified Duganella]|uniref:hypothetical protein n=1 Tax=unclassified Duganella TaxID=2636909 RepID=UPI000B7D605B|nr:MULTISPECIES: hypothetical protein [unclassified Duganella]